MSKDVVEVLHTEVEMMISNLVTWFIFYCTLHITSFISGYLSIMNEPKEVSEEKKRNLNQLLEWGSYILLLSAYAGVAICMICALSFYNINSCLAPYFKSIKLDDGNCPFPIVGFWPFIYASLAMGFICLILAVVWLRIRYNHKFRLPLIYMVRKASLKLFSTLYLYISL